MLIEQGRFVERIDDDTIWVDVELKSSCHACVQQSSCGTGVIARAFAEKNSRVKAYSNEALLLKGQLLSIEIPEQVLTSSSFVLYGLPILFMLVFAALAQLFFGDLITILFIIIGGAVGFKVAAIWSQKNEHLPKANVNNNPKVMYCDKNKDE